MCTTKQGQYIASIIERESGDYQTLKTIWEAQAEHKTEKIDFRIVKLGEKIAERISGPQASMIIGWHKGTKTKYGHDISTKHVFDILVKANLL